MSLVIRPRIAFWAATALAVASVVAAASGAQAAPRAGKPSPAAARPAVGGIHAAAPSDTGASNLSNLGSGGWKVLSSATATQTGQQISTPGFSTSGWLPVANDDAGAPGTELAALQQNGRCPNIFFSNNMQNCYGQLTKVGPDRIKQFSVPWWWRTDFTANLQAGQDAKLIVNGVVGSADVWLNGHQVATSSTVTGAYTRFTFDVTGQVRQGTNSLAIEVNANDPTTMFTLDNVDWTQIPPDNNTGIQFPVQLQVGGPLTDSNAHVLQTNAADLSSSALTVSSDITNTTSSAQAGLVPRPDDRQPAGLVAVPAGRAAAVHADHVGVPEQRGAQLHQRDVRDPERHVRADGRDVGGGAERRPHVQDQRSADRHPRRRLRPEPVPALFRGRYRQADRADEEHGHQRDPAGGPHHARGLLRADGPGRDPGQRGIPVLRRVGGFGHADPCPARDPAAVSADHRAEPAQPPERVQLPVERQRTDRAAGIGVPGGLLAGRLPGPADRFSRVQEQRAARAGRREGGSLRLGPAQLLVRHHAFRRGRRDQRRRLVGLRQRAERRGHRPHPRLHQPVHVRHGPGESVAEAELQPVPHQL